jgi:glycosyltransferase involved in cell wall biosynthesis
LLQFAEGLQKHNSKFQFTWITIDRKLRSRKVTTRWGQQFIRIPCLKVTLDILFGYPFARKALLGELKSLNPDLLHIWGTESAYASVLGHTKLPTLLSMQGILTEYDRIGSFKEDWRMRLQSQHERKWLPLANWVSSESQWGISKVLKIAPSAHTSQVEYGVHPSFYSLTWTPPPEKPTFLFVGTLDWRKGCDLLVEAASSNAGKNWTLQIAGKGMYQEPLSRIPGVEYLGNLDWQQLQAALTKAWALVLPTRADTSPNAVKEARVVGLPVVVSKNGGQAEYIHHEQNGLIIDPLDSQSLRAALDRIAADFNLCIKLGRSRHQEDREYFRPTNTVEGFIQLYNQLTVG